MDINFHQLNLTRGSSYLPPPDWLVKKRTVINPKNEYNEECFKWAVIAALHYADIMSHSERISNLRRFKTAMIGIRVSLSIKGISEFERRNDVIINVLGAEGKKIYPLMGKKYDCQKKVIDLFRVADGE